MTREEAFAKVWAGAAKELPLIRLSLRLTRSIEADLVRRVLKAREFYRRYV